MTSRMRFRFLLGAAIACAAIVPACATSVHSNMTINGKTFGPDACRTLQDEEMFGVDLKDEVDGTTLRIASNVDASITVVVFPSDGTRPLAMTNCSRVDLKRSDNDKYGRYTLDGTAEIHCDGDRFVVEGTTSFDNCAHDF
jgi:hypothetical protein